MVFVILVLLLWVAMFLIMKAPVTKIGDHVDRALSSPEQISTTCEETGGQAVEGVPAGGGSSTVDSPAA